MKTKKEIFDEIVGKPPRRICSVGIIVGLLLIVAGTIIPILSGGNQPFQKIAPLFKYLYSAGALVLLISRLFSPYTGNHERLKRLHRIEGFSAIAFCVGAFFLFYDPYQSRDWLAFTLAGAVLQILSSIMITRVTQKALDRATQTPEKNG